MNRREEAIEEEIREAKAARAEKNRQARRRRQRNRNRVTLLLFIALFLLVGMGFYIRRLEDKAEAFAARESSLAAEIAGEQNRAAELETESKLRQTLKYIEKMAREKLGLVYPDEIILEPEKGTGS